jgi:hypothetical protein
MPMRATTVRFGEDLWRMLEREASAAGTSAAQFVREAAILRLGMLAGLRGDAEARATLGTIAAETQHVPGDGSVTIAVSDPERLAALHETGLLESPAEERFDGLARLAARLLKAPVALVSLVDSDRQYFKSCLGLPEPWQSQRWSPLSHSFCQHAVASKRPLVVKDARQDPRLRDNLAIRDMDVIAYAGIPLVLDGGHAVGTLCVIDDKPRDWTDEEISLLEGVADAVRAQLAHAERQS